MVGLLTPASAATSSMDMPAYPLRAMTFITAHRMFLSTSGERGRPRLFFRFIHPRNPKLQLEHLNSEFTPPSPDKFT
jgi:hypothetical protein